MKPPFRERDIGGHLDDYGIDRHEDTGRRAEARSEPGLDLA